jgi:hypothetical protein
MRLLLRCQGRDETGTFNSQQHCVNAAVLKQLILVWEATVGQEHIVPLLLEHRQEIDNEIRPVVRRFRPDHISANILEDVSATFILLPIPIKIGLTNEFEKIGKVSNLDAFAVCLQQLFQYGRCGVLAVLGFARNANHFHAVTSISSKTTGTNFWNSFKRAIATSRI